MITLKVEEYCQECVEIDPTADVAVLHADGMPSAIGIVVRCRNEERCKHLLKSLKEAEDKHEKPVCEASE